MVFNKAIGVIIINPLKQGSAYKKCGFIFTFLSVS